MKFRKEKKYLIYNEKGQFFSIGIVGKLEAANKRKESNALFNFLVSFFMTIN